MPLNNRPPAADHPVMAIEVSGPTLDTTDLIEQLGDAVVATDLDGKITYFNTAAEVLYGYSADELMGSDVGMLAPGATAERAVAERARVVAGETRRLIGHVQTRSGLLCGVAMTLTPLRDAAGAIVGTIGVTRDVSAQMLRERQHEFMSRLVGETDTVAVVGTDRDGVITIFNRGAEELLGYSA